MATDVTGGVGVGEYQYGFHDPTDRYVFKSRKGLDERIVRQISEMKHEPAWMTEFRLQALKIFFEKPMPNWGGNLGELNFQDIFYFVRASEGQERDWSDVPEDIRKTYDRLGIPEAEKKYLAGVKAQYESEVVYGSLKEDLAQKGVIFTDTDSALKDHPDLFRQYFATIIPSADNKFAALNSAVWSGGSFIYVPPGVSIEFPLQAYFRINSENMGQFERTLIIVDEGASVHYVEGCTAPTYSTESLHSAVVEIIVKRGGRCRYTTIQNWSSNVYNLVTKRAVASADSVMEWVDGNLGSKLTMKYPAIYLMEPAARGKPFRSRSLGKVSTRTPGAKMVHCAPHTSSRIVSKSISKAGGRASYRGLVRVNRDAKQCRSNVVCDALILDPQSRSDTYPYIEVEEDQVSIEHEASVSKIAEEQLFYLMSRGLSEAEASTMIVSGFIEPLVKELPMEYAVEMNRLIELQMEGSVGCPVSRIVRSPPLRSHSAHLFEIPMTVPSKEALVDRRAGFDRTAFEAFLESRDEPGWVTDSRRKAFELYSERLERPLDAEEFKRVDLRAFRPDAYAVSPRAGATAEFATLLADRAKFAGSVVHVDGTGTRTALDESLARQGVLFGDLTALVRDHRRELSPNS